MVVGKPGRRLRLSLPTHDDSASRGRVSSGRVYDPGRPVAPVGKKSRSRKIPANAATMPPYCCLTAINALARRRISISACETGCGLPAHAAPEPRARTPVSPPAKSMSIRNFEKLFRPAQRRADRRQRAAGLGRRGRRAQPAARRVRRRAAAGQPHQPRRSTAAGLRGRREPAARRPISPSSRRRPRPCRASIAELGARGTKAAVVITAGFGELGERGRALQQAVLDAARPHLLRLVGPNCIG